MYKTHSFTRFLGALIALSCVVSVSSFADSYAVKTVNPKSTPVIETSLPDISGYTHESVKQKITKARQLPKGSVSQEYVRGQVELRLLYGGQGLFGMANKQSTVPTSLTISKGVVELEEVNRAFPDLLIKQNDGSYLAVVPIVVSIGGTLVIEGEMLKMSEERGSFLVNGGHLFLSESALIGWRETSNVPALYTGDKKKFRPYFVGWGDSETYFSKADVRHLGYFSTKAFGVTLSSYQIKHSEEMFQRDNFDFHEPPRGWFIDTDFVDLYYGFYCFEAEDVAIINNTYIDNVVYGIDPHDISSHLIIARNLVYGTKEKHGIIISRQVNDSFIFDNVSHSNYRSGIMLDRMSERNQVVNNTVYNNGGDGITIYESNSNLIANNKVYRNRSHGIRSRNSQYIVMKDNVVLSNKGFGIYLDIGDLSSHVHRDLVLDPYEQLSSGDVKGGIIAHNSSGSIYIKDGEYFSLYDVKIEDNGGKVGQLEFGGDLAKYHNDVVRALWTERGVASLTRQEEF
ncbi:right-handed parallel beta-helix repeat-containing protein [Echinimonas agarilytica]|uniref:Right-handed parallel beta-helix repeat-containing protein n=1 Tax=Echinimonas agarilytica TaxID=1215918 RepID=A0AA41WBY9_9GAMM|nr:right-handed parallel beta-helix repeat-containing protein [Echinimonas agarilytica]MCM2681224.1 right-handed parallel beta-helix repeat-containing protein [Echinimonas agarilytica]